MVVAARMNTRRQWVVSNVDSLESENLLRKVASVQKSVEVKSVEVKSPGETPNKSKKRRCVQKAQKKAGEATTMEEVVMEVAVVGEAKAVNTNIEEKEVKE